MNHTDINNLKLEIGGKVIVAPAKGNITARLEAFLEEVEKESAKASNSIKRIALAESHSNERANEVMEITNENDKLKDRFVEMRTKFNSADNELKRKLKELNVANIKVKELTKLVTDKNGLLDDTIAARDRAIKSTNSNLKGWDAASAVIKNLKSDAKVVEANHQSLLFDISKLLVDLKTWWAIKLFGSSLIVKIDLIIKRLK